MITNSQPEDSLEGGTSRAGVANLLRRGLALALAYLMIPVGIGDVYAQSVAAAQTLSPVVVEATDAIGRPMAGATVTFYETMCAWTPACAGSEDCPSPPVLGQQTVTAVSGSDGTVSLTPIANQGLPVRIVVQATVGPNGEYDFELEQAPSE